MNYNQEPLVSISCITYNHKNYIRECLDGFLMQKTTFPFEIIIHDDCSTDGTREIIEEYAAKYPDIIFPMFQTENQYSKGVRSMMVRFNFTRCKGKYIALCEGDDYWTDSFKLQKQVDFLEKNSDFSICFHNLKVYNEIDATTDKVACKNQKSVLDIIDLATRGNFIHTPSVVFKMPEDGLPSWFINLPIGDYPLHLFNAQFGKIKYIDEVMGVYRIHAGGTWGHMPKEKLSERWIEMLTKIENKFSPEIGYLLKDMKKRSLFNLFIISVNQKNEEKAREVGTRIMEVDPYFLANKIITSEEKQDEVNKKMNSRVFKISCFIKKKGASIKKIFKLKKQKNKNKK
jgi:glycosyltransferase involved in cell wall biosynthesis